MQVRNKEVNDELYEEEHEGSYMCECVEGSKKVSTSIVE